MKNRRIILIFLSIIAIILIIVGLILFLNKTNNNDNINNNINDNNKKDTITNNESSTNQTFNTLERENKPITNMKVKINENSYNAELEENETTKSLIEMLPLEYTMNDLNNNEKYIYLNTNLPTNTYSPQRIEKGDIMLYGNNCLVIFYKSFDTPYSYTKIGHIENLPDLGNESITIKLENN